MEKALPLVEAAFPTFHEFAAATLADIVGEKPLADALELSANTAVSVVLRNDGAGHFTVEPLPVLAQVSASLRRGDDRLQCRRVHRCVSGAELVFTAPRDRPLGRRD